MEAPEQAMLDRLTSIAAGDMEPTSYDLHFYTYELDEAARYAKLQELEALQQLGLVVRTAAEPASAAGGT